MRNRQRLRGRGLPGTCRQDFLEIFEPFHPGSPQTAKMPGDPGPRPGNDQARQTHAYHRG